MTGVKFSKAEYPKPALDKSTGMLGMRPLRPSPSVPQPVILPEVRSALSAYPQQKPEIMRVIRAKEAVPPVRQRVYEGKG
jgi:hypothetical protein